VPIYRYRCKFHGDFEVEQETNDPDLTNCPKHLVFDSVDDDFETCHEPLQKLISGSGSFILKGKGFYSNDSKPRTNK